MNRKKYILFPVLAFAALLISLVSMAKEPRITGSDVPQYGTPFAHVPDRRDVVIYQVNMRAFSPEGNFAGVTARLDSIKDLGANVIYLMPIYPVGILKSVNSPYCLRDYTTINTEFGDLNDLRALIDGAHRRNMSVILDWVGNHTSWDHTWISAHKDWYKQDSTGKIVSAGFGWTDVAQLDFSNMDMRREMIREMKDWVYKANVDGFRCDYADGPPVDFWKQAIDTLRSIRSHKLLFLAEGSRSENFTAGFDYNFGFHFFGNLEQIFKEDRSVTTIDSVNIKEYKDAEDGQQMVRYTTNHDVNGSDGTPLYLFGGRKGSMAAFAVVATMKSVPMIYNGQEKGMNRSIKFPFTSVKIDWTVNPDITAAYKKIIAIRNGSEAIRRGALTSYTTKNVCAYTKIAGKETVFVVSDLREEEIKYEVPAQLVNTNWTDMVSGKKIRLGNTLQLAPYEYLIMKKD